MFGLSGLNHSQIKQLQEEYAIYIPANGRMNFCGLNAGNVEYVAQSLLDIICLKFNFNLDCDIIYLLYKNKNNKDKINVLLKNTNTKEILTNSIFSLIFKKNKINYIKILFIANMTNYEHLKYSSWVSW